MEGELGELPTWQARVLELADQVLSTSGMLKFAKESKAKEMIVATENGIIHRLQKDSPDKTFYPVSTRIICPNMKKITLEKVLWSLEELREEVIVPKGIADKARLAIERMVALPG